MANEPTPFNQISAALKGRQEKIEALLPQFMKGQSERLVARALQYWARGTPQLQNCTVASFVGCVLQAAELGFAVDGRLTYAVPYKDRAQLIPSYIGLIAVAKRTGLIQDCWARIVLKEDVLTFEEHDGCVSYDYIPNLELSRDRGENVRGILSVATHSGDWRRADWMPWVDVLSIRARSKAKDSGPWVTDPGEMAKKTGLRRLLKTFSDDPGLLRAMELEDQVESPGPSETIEVAAERRRSIIPIAAVEDHSNDLPPWDVPSESIKPVAAETEAEILTPPPESQDAPPPPFLRVSPEQIVEQYKRGIEACTSLKDANRLVTTAGNDPYLRSPPLEGSVIAYVLELLQGNVAKWKQTKGQKGLIP